MAFVSADSGSVESAQCNAFHTVWVRRSVLAFAVDRFCLLRRLRLFAAGLLRGWLLSFVQAWEGEIRYFVHRRRSSQGLFFQSQVIPRFQKALAGYSTVNDKKTFISTDVRIVIWKSQVT